MAVKVVCPMVSQHHILTLDLLVLVIILKFIKRVKILPIETKSFNEKVIKNTECTLKG